MYDEAKSLVPFLCLEKGPLSLAFVYLEPMTEWGVVLMTPSLKSAVQ